MARRTTVLILEGDPVAREIMADLLRRDGYRVLVTGNRPQALGAIHPGVDVALIDWMLFGAAGEDVCRRVKEVTEGVAYAIMITARAAQSEIVRAFDSGADDYLTKPINHHELMARVRAGERTARRGRELAAACEEAQSAAERDGLTGLMNRRSFDRELRQRLRELPAGESLALLMIDLDRFKRINDSFGHQAGDEVLRRVATIISGQAREGIDVVARYGGEELAVIAPGASFDYALEVAHRIRRRIEQARTVVEDELISVTASIGVALLEGPIEDVEEAARSLIEQADTRLYRAKRAGRNRVAA